MTTNITAPRTENTETFVGAVERKYRKGEGVGRNVIGFYVDARGAVRCEHRSVVHFGTTDEQHTIDFPRGKPMTTAEGRDVWRSLLARSGFVKSAVNFDAHVAVDSRDAWKRAV